MEKHIPNKMPKAADIADVSEETKDEVKTRVANVIVGYDRSDIGDIEATAEAEVEVLDTERRVDFSDFDKFLGIDEESIERKRLHDRIFNQDDDSIDEDASGSDKAEWYIDDYYDRSYRLSKEDPDLNEKSESDGNISNRITDTIGMVEVPEKTKDKVITRILDSFFRPNENIDREKVDADFAAIYKELLDFDDDDQYFSRR